MTRSAYIHLQSTYCWSKALNEINGFAVTLIDEKAIEFKASQLDVVTSACNENVADQQKLKDIYRFAVHLIVVKANKLRAP